MGTSTMGSDLHSDKQDKLIKLQARKKELEQMLAAKNEELYKLCVQEVQLTGIMPPEAPLSPEVPQRDRLGSIRSVDRSTDGTDVQDGSDTASRRLKISDRHEAEQNLLKNISHRLSTPSLRGSSGGPGKNVHPRQIRRPETSSNFFPSPPQERNPETFSIHTSHTYPHLANRHEGLPNENIHVELQQGPVYRHHTMATEYANKIYYNNTPSEPHNVSRLRETHFSSSHPDITTHYTHASIAQHSVPPQNGMRSTPLLYQYASQLKAQSQHLGALNHHHQMQAQPKRRNEGVRRNTLQRTQTYHLTSHSDYNHHLENMSDAYRPPVAYQHRSQPDIQDQPIDRVHIPVERNIPVPNTLPLRERITVRNPLHLQLQVSTDDYVDERRQYTDPLSPVSQISGYSNNFDSVSMNKFSPMSQDSKKEKHWYETSLDSPTREAPMLKKSASLKRTPSLGNSQPYEIMISAGRHLAMHSPNHIPNSPPVLSPGAISLESPKNLTVIEQGKCIPYREETKPFEMSDFYKYSTKFRQANVQKAAPPQPVQNINNVYNKLPMELPQYSQENWHDGN